ncbi:hypothetical protein JMF89_00920 [Clostridiaceae bacterium UIB06]|uniref:Uncharacterized protein n=1 Tax=Clostridium thailandense TaxID=2794346 RepID=A0A949TX25_9CLOT|nr:hypothetical protein [Clostridium thailandense]MBV7273115.1 hypothetical protein [Clostridium thailandense]MCH5135779.1 hypothetical protein [Clostridiaceae bacterium UIB06]
MKVKDILKEKQPEEFKALITNNDFEENDFDSIRRLMEEGHVYRKVRGRVKQVR